MNLDEYKGLSPENDQSYRYFMNTNLFDHVNIDKTRTFVPNGLEADSDKACSEYNEIIRKQGGVDFSFSVLDTTDTSDSTSQVLLLKKRHTV